MIMNVEKKFMTLMRHFEAEDAKVSIGGTDYTAFYFRKHRKEVASKYAADIAGSDADHPVNKRPGTCPSSNFGFAVLAIANGKAAVGSTNSGKHVAELVCDDGTVQYAIFDPKKGVFKGCVLAEDDDTPQRYMINEGNPLGANGLPTKTKTGHYATVLVLSMLPELFKDEEFKTNYDKVMNILTTAIAEETPISSDMTDELTDALAVATDNAEFRMGYKELKTTVYVDYDNYMSAEREVPLLKIPDVQAGGRYHPSTIDVGKFNILTIADTVDEEQPSGSSDSVWDKYTLTTEYQDSPYLPVVDKETTLVPDYVETMCQHVVASKKFRNFGMRGSAGSGKSMSAKIMAAMLHVPHYVFTCSANTEISDFQGQIIPVLKSAGDDSENKTLQYTYAESPLLKAVRYGGVIEIQEPNVIVQPGVIVGLNGIMEPDGILTLPTGEVVRRHPNTIVVITTNVTYEGCRDMNVSLLDRLDLVFDVNNPSVEELVERCKAQTGFKDDALLKEMAQIVEDTSEAMNKDGIEDGTAGLRSLINWAQSTMITGDPYSSGLNCLISKTTSSAEDREKLAKRLASATFAKRKRARKI